MTPRLQHTIRLLQLSTIELQTEVQETLDSNFMLEVDDDPDPIPSGARGKVEQIDMPDRLAIDSGCEDRYDMIPIGHHLGPDRFNDADVEINYAGAESLRDHLYWQMSLTRCSDIDRVIGATIIDAVDDSGYLTLTLDDIRQSLDSRHHEISIEAVAAVLRRVQNLDPPGIATRSVDECLALQLRQLPADTKWRDPALTLVTKHLHALASKDYARLMQVLDLDEQMLRGVIDLVRSLSPRPGSAIGDAAPEYVFPDIFVHKETGIWRVTLNPEVCPKLRINSHYAHLIQRSDNSADHRTLKNHLQEARWFIKSIQSRNETLLKTATYIVNRQQKFFEHGEAAMQPMKLADISQTIGLHESTISRVTTRKYMQTPRGIFELKYFFTNHVYANNGSSLSSAAIRAVLRKLIAAENPTQPLSDSRLAAILSDQGVEIARRTVAKYREAMAIPASTKRRAL